MFNMHGERKAQIYKNISDELQMLRENPKNM